MKDQIETIKLEARIRFLEGKVFVLEEELLESKGREESASAVVRVLEEEEKMGYMSRLQLRNEVEELGLIIDCMEKSIKADE